MLISSVVQSIRCIGGAPAMPLQYSTGKWWWRWQWWWQMMTMKVMMTNNDDDNDDDSDDDRWDSGGTPLRVTVSPAFLRLKSRGGYRWAELRMRLRIAMVGEEVLCKWVGIWGQVVYAAFYAWIERFPNQSSSSNVQLVNSATAANITNITRVQDIFSGEHLGRFLPGDRLTIQVEPWTNTEEIWILDFLLCNK